MIHTLIIAHNWLSTAWFPLDLINSGVCSQAVNRQVVRATVRCWILMTKELSWARFSAVNFLPVNSSPVLDSSRERIWRSNSFTMICKATPHQHHTLNQASSPCYKYHHQSCLYLVLEYFSWVLLRKCLQLHGVINFPLLPTSVITSWAGELKEVLQSLRKLVWPRFQSRYNLHWESDRQWTHHPDRFKSMSIIAQCWWCDSLS